jgi:hypothetical protein
VRRAFSLHPDASAHRSEVAARYFMGRSRWARRRDEIAALPSVEWKGRTLRALRCQGTSGRGPHDVNVPVDLLWQLLSLRSYFCPFHAGDQLNPKVALR